MNNENNFNLTVSGANLQIIKNADGTVTHTLVGRKTFEEIRKDEEAEIVSLRAQGREAEARLIEEKHREKEREFHAQAINYYTCNNPNPQKCLEHQQKLQELDAEQTRQKIDIELSQTQSITLLRSLNPNCKATKTFTKTETGIEKTSYGNSKYFSCEQRLISNIFEVHELLTSLQNDPQTFVIRGILREGVNPNRVNRRIHARDNEPPSFRAAPAGSRLGCLDIDNILMLEGFSIDSNPLELVLAVIKANLPPYFKDVTVHFQFSSSFGIKNQTTVKLHLWYFLDRPIPDNLLNEWAKTIECIDPATFRTVQPIYTANPICIGFEDPIKQRSGLIRGSKDCLSIPQNELDSQPKPKKIKADKNNVKIIQKQNIDHQHHKDTGRIANVIPHREIQVEYRTEHKQAHFLKALPDDTMLFNALDNHFRDWLNGVDSKYSIDTTYGLPRNNEEFGKRNPISTDKKYKSRIVGSVNWKDYRPFKELDYTIRIPTASLRKFVPGTTEPITEFFNGKDVFWNFFNDIKKEGGFKYSRRDNAKETQEQLLQEHLREQEAARKARYEAQRARLEQERDRLNQIELGLMKPVKIKKPMRLNSKRKGWYIPYRQLRIQHNRHRSPFHYLQRKGFTPEIAEKLGLRIHNAFWIVRDIEKKGKNGEVLKDENGKPITTPILQKLFRTVNDTSGRYATIFENAKGELEQHTFSNKENVKKMDFLAVPMYGADGYEINTQKIYDDGSKQFNQGETKGGFFIIPAGIFSQIDLEKDYTPSEVHEILSLVTGWEKSEAVEVEGFVTGLSVREILDACCIHIPVIVAFTAGNLLHVANILHDIGWRNVPIIADNDWKHDIRFDDKAGNVGITKAIETSNMLGYSVTYPTFNNSYDTVLSDVIDETERNLYKALLAFAHGEYELSVEQVHQFFSIADSSLSYLFSKPDEHLNEDATEWGKHLHDEWLEAWDECHEFLPSDDVYTKNLPSDVNDLVQLEEKRTGSRGQALVNAFTELTENLFPKLGTKPEYTASNEVREMVAEVIEAGYRYSQILKLTASAGKTTGVINDVIAKFKETGEIKPTFYFSCTNALSMEVEEKLQELERYIHINCPNFPVKTIFGRGYKPPGCKNSLCPRHEEIESYLDTNGVEAYSNHCAQLRDMPEVKIEFRNMSKVEQRQAMIEAPLRLFERCDHFTECEYLNQYREARNLEAKFILFSHERMLVEKGFLEYFLPEAQRMIIDERFWDKFVKDSHLSVEDFLNPHEEPLPEWEAVKHQLLQLLKNPQKNRISLLNNSIDFEGLIQKIKAILPATLKYGPCTPSEVIYKLHEEFNKARGHWSKIIKVLQLLHEEAQESVSDGIKRVKLVGDKIEYCYLQKNDSEHSNRFINSYTRLAVRIHEILDGLGMHFFTEADIAPRKCLYMKQNRVKPSYYLFDPSKTHVNKNGNLRHHLAIPVEEFKQLRDNGVPVVERELARLYMIIKENGSLKDSLFIDSQLNQLKSHNLLKIHEGGRYELVQENKAKNLANLRLIPLTIIDQDADPEIIQAVLPEYNFHFTQINVKWNMYIKQLVSATNSKRSLDLSDNAVKWVIDHLEKAFAEGKDISTLIIGPAMITGNPKQEKAPHPLLKQLIADYGEEKVQIALEHFNNLRGLDKYKQFKEVITLGRNQPRFSQILKYANALFWKEDIIQNESPIWERRAIRMKNGKFHIVKVQVMEDKRAQRILEQFRERELLQAAARIRPVHASEQVVWQNRSNIPLPDIEVDEIESTQAANNKTASFDQKTSEVFNYFILKKNFLPLTPALLAEHAVDKKGKKLFKSAADARVFLNKKGLEGLKDKIKSELSLYNILLSLDQFKNVLAQGCPTQIGLMEYGFAGQKRQSYILYFYRTGGKTAATDACIDWLESLAGKGVQVYDYDCALLPESKAESYVQISDTGRQKVEGQKTVPDDGGGAQSKSMLDDAVMKACDDIMGLLSRENAIKITLRFIKSFFSLTQEQLNQTLNELIQKIPIEIQGDYICAK